MEDESNNSEMETAFNDDNVLARLEATLDDMPEASDNSEQAEDHVEKEPVADDASETPDTDEQFFDINGEQVSLSEIRSSYLRQADYTKKTQEIAEQRKVYQTDLNQIRHDALQGIEMTKKELVALFGDELESNINWQQLAEDDPHRWAIEREKWAAREARVQALHQTEMQLRQQMEADERAAHQHALQESQKLFLTKYPEMRDQGKSAQALGEITSLLIDNGFTQEEINGVSDWRIVGILYELNKAIKAQKAIPDVVAKMEQKPVISQKQNSSKTSDAYTRDFAKFNKTRSGKDALSLIEQLL
ncbi:hypothetical protein [Ensifer canadensis]